MNWIRENKFLAGFIAVLVVGGIGLAYLLYTAWGAYDEVSDQYTQQAEALRHLQSLTPYPDKANLDKYRAERDSVIATTGSLASSQAEMVLPVEEINPSTFQDRLRDALSAIVKRAGQTGVKLPEKFAMDFDQYQYQPPPAAAAGPLGRQLEALQMVVNFLIEDHVESIDSLKRVEKLPQEKGGGGGGGGRQGGGGGGRSGVERVPFDLQFVATQAAFRKVLNDLAASKKQFFITRTLVVENSSPKQVPKTPEVAAAPPPAAGQPGGAPSPAPGAPDVSGTGNYLQPIVGTEKVNVAMRIDMVTFNIPARK